MWEFVERPASYNQVNHFKRALDLEMQLWKDEKSMGVKVKSDLSTQIEVGNIWELSVVFIVGGRTA